MKKLFALFTMLALTCALVTGCNSGDTKPAAEAEAGEAEAGEAEAGEAEAGEAEAGEAEAGEAEAGS